jgi:RimJ/RimL family protein N-acetyltransferase
VSIAVAEPVRPERRERLDDGREVLIRRLTAADEPVLRSALTHADPMDLRKRFLGPPPPTSTIVRQLRRVDDVHDLALGAFDTAGQLVGVAQFDRLDDQPVAEFAIELGTAWQRHGLGRIMLDALADEARAVGITRLTASYYADNIPVRRLIHHTGRVIESGIRAGEGYAVLDLAGAVMAASA